MIFESTIGGYLALSPNGIAKEFFWPALSLVFIPESKIITLGEMSNSEYLRWKRGIRDCFADKFADWLCKNR